MQYYFYGKIIKDKLELENKSILERLVKIIGKNSEKPVKVEMTIKEYRGARTNKQNSFYWLYLDVIEKETGQFSEELHEYFKRKFLAPRELEMFNDKIKIPSSTTKLNKIEFSKYLNKIELLTGVPIPSYDGSI